MLGPFDYGCYKEEEDIVGGNNDDTSDKDEEDVEDEKRIHDDIWSIRKSGAQYRGSVDVFTHRPDGRGIKIFDKKSMYEGYF